MTDPRIHERRVVVARERGRTRRRRLGAGVLAAMLAAGGLLALHSSIFGARSVRVIGARHTSRGAIIAAAKLGGSPPLVDVSPAQAARRLKHLPWIASATVAVSWPSTVTVRVSERVPVAAVALRGEKVAICDFSGHVIEILPARPKSLPLVVVRGRVASPGQVLARNDARLTAAASALPQSMVAETSALFYGKGGIELRLRDGIVALVGSQSLLNDKLVALATVLSHGGLDGIATIDLRDPAVPVLLPRT
ncbi:MAG: cell division protein FtsQ/DivIB [Acidimicrobiales bacterium]